MHSQTSMLLLAAGLLLANISVAEDALEISFKGERINVLPVGHNARDIYAFAANGDLLTIPVKDAKDPKVVPNFRPWTQVDARGQLLREYGDGFEVSGTGNFLIVHPRGTKDLWTDRFEELYRSMIHFFRTRGMPLETPKFPLVGVVFHSQAQYEQYCRTTLNTIASNTYGLYLPTTNRLYLYDATQGTGRKSAEWAENVATVMHECAHQTAFNTGIHERGFSSPRWVVEGLGCHFEARGVFNSFLYKDLEDRLNVGRLADFQTYVAPAAIDVISGMIASDKAFQADPRRSYAAAWGLTFYFTEREPRNYIRYLQVVAKRDAFAQYSSAERVRDFASIFGNDYRMLATRVTRFLNDLRPSTVPQAGQY